jgi:sulfofructose kinase
MIDVVGVGANSIDFVYLLPDFPRPDSPTAKLPISAHRMSPGGQMATALCTCAALGLQTSYVGVFGSDDNGRRMRETLESRGVRTDAARTRDAANRYAVILIDERRGERVILWHRDPALTLDEGELARDLLTTARVVHVDDEDQTMAIAAARLARGAGLRVSSDIDRVTPRTREVIDAVSIPILAEHVAAAVTGEHDIAAALRALRAPHHQMLCVTLGARGALLLHDEHVQHVPGFHVEAVDTTGAGDVFRGAFIYALLRGDAPPDIVRFANAAAAVACTRLGAIAGVPTLEQIDERMNDER